jgi:hypothetical protein
MNETNSPTHNSRMTEHALQGASTRLNDKPTSSSLGNMGRL